MRLIRIPLVKLFYFAFGIQIIPRNLFKCFVIDVFLEIAEVAVEFFVLGRLFLLPKQISQVYVKNHNYFADGDESSIKTQLDREQTRFFY